jgi:CO/xanthine dehydrogenase FAD-binding subunit
MEEPLMRPIQYAAPQSIPDAVAILNQFAGRARVLAGGTDLIVQVREHARDIDVMVDGKQIPELMQLSFDPQKGLTLGASVPCHVIYNSPLVIERYPGLIDAVSLIGGTAIQGRASVGGNLCNSGPAGDSIPALIAHGATARIVGPEGERVVPVEEFCTGPGRNVLRNNELLVSLQLPPPTPHSGARYLRFIPRNEMDIAEVGVGAWVVLSPAGDTFRQARIALGAVGPTPITAAEASAALSGQPVTEETISAAAAAAQAAARPISDMRGTAEHRRHLVGVLTRRALHGAVERARRG